MQSSAKTADVLTDKRFKLPIIFYRIGHGGTQLTLDLSRIQDYLELSEEAMTHLHQSFPQPNLYQLTANTKRGKKDYKALAQGYQKMIDEGVCKNYADIAKHYGVTRAWITKVMKNK